MANIRFKKKEFWVLVTFDPFYYRNSKSSKNLFEKHKPKSSIQSKERKQNQNMGVGPIGSIWFQRRRLNIKVYRQ